MNEPTPTQSPVFFSYGFRPFFLAGAIWAFVSLGVWLVVLEGLSELPSAFDPFAWHAHEMIFGFVGAIIAGFLLSAIAAWTGRPPVQGTPLIVLFVLWITARLLVTYSAHAGAWIAAIVDVGFYVFLTVLAGREIVAAGNKRNYPIIGLLVALTIANALMHMSVLELSDTRIMGERLGIGIVVLLIGLIGGRIAPAFTRNWLNRQGKAVTPPSLPIIDKVAHGLTAAAMLAWASDAFAGPASILAIGAGILQAWRMARWGGEKALGEPIVAVLHVGYAWVPIGLIMLGLTHWIDVINPNAALHALTAGAMGTMILAVMTRATLGHTGHAISSTSGTTAIFAFVVLAAVLRVLGPHSDDLYRASLIASGVVWIMAFVLFVALYGPYLVKPRSDA